MPELLMEREAPRVEDLIAALGGGEIMTNTSVVEVAAAPDIDRAFEAELGDLVEEITPVQERSWKQVWMSKRGGGGDCCVGSDEFPQRRRR